MKTKIFKDIKKLKFPLGEYMVVGSGIMAVYGIRDYKDIDILVSKKLFNRLLNNKKWKLSQIKNRGSVLKMKKYEVANSFLCKNYRPDTNWLIKNAEIINGVPFLPFSELVKFKKALGRKKDLRDIQLIEKHLKNKI